MPEADHLVWTVCARFGQNMKPYLWRQVYGFTGFGTKIVTWEFHNRDRFHDLDVFSLDQIPEPYTSRRGKYKWLLANLATGNAYATHGQERRILSDLAKKDRPQVIFVHLGQFALRILPIKREIDVPLICRFAGIDTFPMGANPIYHKSLKRHIREIDQIVVVAKCQREWILDFGYPQDRVHVIPAGAPIPSDIQSLQPKGRGNDIVFLTASSLIPIKGLEYTIQAFAGVAAKYERATLRIIGDGPLRDDLKQLSAQLGVAERVAFLGEQPPEDVIAEMENCDVFLQHSLETPQGREGASVAITEALGRMCPVIATDCGGNGDQVIDGVTGYLVPQRDIAAMVSRMAELAGDREKRLELGRGAHAFVVKEFNSEIQARKLCDLIKSCL